MTCESIRIHGRKQRTERFSSLPQHRPGNGVFVKGDKNICGDDLVCGQVPVRRLWCFEAVNLIFGRRCPKTGSPAKAYRKYFCIGSIIFHRSGKPARKETAVQSLEGLPRAYPEDLTGHSHTPCPSPECRGLRRALQSKTETVRGRAPARRLSALPRRRSHGAPQMRCRSRWYSRR